MAISVENLKTLVLNNVNKSDEVIIISGYTSPDILEEIAKTGKPVTFFYGMYRKNGLSLPYASAFSNIETKYPNFVINIPYDYHVHTKCYIFRKAGVTFNALVGSANCSSSALITTKNSELLMDVAAATDIADLDNYANEVATASLHFDNPAIIPSVRSKVIAATTPRNATHPRSWHYDTGNPFSAYLPLYTMERGNPKVQAGDGLNWGLGPTHHTSGSLYAEACIPIRAFEINHYPTLIPYHGNVGAGTGGKSTRRQGTIEVLWDDGSTMRMHFEGNGPERPTRGTRATGAPFRTYPKQLTSDNGGAILGKYLRDRIGVDAQTTITYKDLKKYGRDYITFTLTNAGNYEADFHV